MFLSQEAKERDSAYRVCTQITHCRHTGAGTISEDDETPPTDLGGQAEKHA